MAVTKDRIREEAEKDLYKFIKLVQPHRYLGHVHKELIQWWTRSDALSHQLVLLPRDHMKSALAAFRVAHAITNNPAIRVLYISSTSNLAQKQLKFIKDILTCDKYREYWPEMVSLEETKREKWTETEVSVDHPLRKQEAVRDPTIFTAGLTTNIVGLHCDIAVLDDVVVDDTADTEEGRQKVRNQASYLASIASTDSKIWVVGTRYHPKDLYNDFMEMCYDIYDENGNVLVTEMLYELFEREVEDSQVGTGNFLWPRRKEPNGKWYGFNALELAKKKAQYADITKFRAQYYNNPNDASESAISSNHFQYFDRQHLKQESGRWYYRNLKLNIFAAVDFAFSLSNKADYTAIVVVGIDASNNYYVLDIDRFRSNKISEYFDHILKLHTKWEFRTIRAEVTVAQEIIAKDLKENYIRKFGLALSIDEHRPSRLKGTKEERIDAALQPKYNNKQMWHYKGGNCELLEEELINQKPAHDDIKDCLAAVIEICIPPSGGTATKAARDKIDYFHSRFGGTIN